MPYYTDSDTNGKIIGFYHDSVNSNIPASTIQITDEEWQDAMSNQGKWLVDKTLGKLVLAPPVEPPPPAPPPPNWNTFNNGLLSNAAYNKVTQFSVNQSAVRRLESIAISSDIANSSNQDYTKFIFLWNAMIDGLPTENQLTDVEVDGWIAIALAANMPFSFAQDGKIVLIR